ncbi:MAG: hypothetical protein IJ193_04620 [Bacilli bacterium]|nr:hypothetical protein [Bacilli bacterium]
MKRILLILISCVLLCGCSRMSEKELLHKFTKSVRNADSYYVVGDLELRNHDDIYRYQVDVSYEKKANYKVSLTNQANDSTQIILKNSDGVYILTPSLNRSFKFQSDWPYQNSQIYLLDALLRDLKRDDLSMEKNDDGYIFQTSVDYPNNKDLTYQKIYFNKKLKLKKIIVYDKEDVPSMEFTIKKIDYSPSFSKDYFDLEKIMGSQKMEDTKETAELEDTIYPLILPDNTKLSNEEKIKKDRGERILMTFEGDSPFFLVEETANVEEEFTVIPTSGEPYPLMDTLGVMTDNSLSWVSNGIEYYLVSDVLSSEELTKIAESIYALPTMK